MTQIKQLSLQKCGRPLLLDEKRDRMLQTYLRRSGGVVSSWIVITAAKGLMITVDQANWPSSGDIL